MRQWIKRKQRGFTLIELMIVVAIVGILSVLAIYGVRKYIANAKTAEARNSIGQIAKDGATAVEREKGTLLNLPPGQSAATVRSFCASSTSVPDLATKIKGAKYQSTAGDWGGDANSGWVCLKFTMDEPQYFMYKYTATATDPTTGGFSVTANGDLNGDSNLSTFEIDATANAGVVSISPTIVETAPEE